MYVIFAWKNWIRHMFLQQLWRYCTSITKGSVPESMKSMRVMMRIRILSSFNKMVWRLKVHHGQSEEIRCNLEDCRFGCFLSSPLKHQIHFVLSWTIPELRAQLAGGDQKLLLWLCYCWNYFHLEILRSATVFLYVFLLALTSLHCTRAAGPSFQSTVLNTDSKVSRPVHFLLWSTIFFHFFKAILSIESLAEEGLPRCNMQLASIGWLLCIFSHSHDKTIYKGTYQH